MGISRIKQLSAGTAGRVKKQLNDLFLFVSYDLHKEYAVIGVVGVQGQPDGKATADSDVAILKILTTDPTVDTVKDWEASVKLWDAPAIAAAATLPAAAKVLGTPMLEQTKGELMMLILDSPAGHEFNTTVKLQGIRKSDAVVPAVAAVQATGTVTIQTAGANGDSLAVTIDGETYTVNQDGTKTVAQLRTELIAAFTAGTKVTAVADAAAGQVNLTAVAVGAAGNLLVQIVDTGTLAAVGTNLTGGVNASGGTKAFTEYEFQLGKAAGMDQGLYFVDSQGLVVDDLVAIDWADVEITGASRGLNIKLISVPHKDLNDKTQWLYHAFVRQINPNVPKDYKEVADHFDGAADTIRAIAIPTLTIQKVFESVPGSFRNLRGRKCTMKAETRELNRADSSETHYFLGVIGTPTIQFQADNESIAQLEATMYKWVVVS